MTAWDAVAQFGQSIGLGSFGLDQGSAVLDLDSGETLGFFLDEEVLLVHLSHPLPHPDPDLTMRALQRCEVRDLPGFSLQAGSRGEGADFALIVATRLPADSLQPESVALACERLLDWMTQTVSSP